MNGTGENKVFKLRNNFAYKISTTGYFFYKSNSFALLLHISTFCMPICFTSLPYILFICLLALLYRNIFLLQAHWLCFTSTCFYFFINLWVLLC